jgi:hypothetical protein
LTRIELQSTLRRLLMRPSRCCPAMSKRSRSPSFVIGDYLFFDGVWKIKKDGTECDWFAEGFW